ERPAGGARCAQARLHRGRAHRCPWRGARGPDGSRAPRTFRYGRTDPGGAFTLPPCHLRGTRWPDPRAGEPMSEHGNISALLALPDRFADLEVWVVGDLMLDEYVTGTVERISPEAPVPVVCAQATEHRLGGAANVARQVATLGARVSLAGICGEDAAGDELLQLCAHAGIDARAVLKVRGRHTTRKLRVVSHSQQLLRLDWEDIQPCAADLTQGLLEKLACGPPPAAIIVSDYAKGVLSTDMLSGIMRSRGSIPLVIDPKHRDFARYRGATTVTPNLHELEVACGHTLPVEYTA